MESSASEPRPQLLMLMLLGDYVLDQDLCVFAGSFIEVLGRLGVSEHATRSTLSRMVNRGLLRRRREGRRMYFGLTPRSTASLHDGQARIWKAGAVNDQLVPRRMKGRVLSLAWITQVVMPAILAGPA